MKFYKNICHVLFSATLLMGMQSSLFASKDCSIDLQYIQIKDDLWETEAEAIQHQFDWQEVVSFSPMKELEYVEDFIISLTPSSQQSEADSRSNVYGYHRDGSLDLTGGPKKSYNRNFKDFYLRYHAAFEGKYPFGSPQNPIVTVPLTLDRNAVKNIYQQNIPYFVQRGFEIQGTDLTKKFKDQFIWTMAAGQAQSGGYSPSYVALRLIWQDKDLKDRNKCKSQHLDSDIPAFVDLHATANTTFQEYFVLDTYKRHKSKQKNGYGYPTRIPVTADFCRYQKSYNKHPIAFFDKSCHVLTIHVPYTDSNDYFLTRRLIETGNPSLDINYIEHLAGFDGSFKVFERKKSGELIASNLKNAELFAQVSKTVNIRSRVVRNPENGGKLVYFEYANPIQARPLEPDASTLYYTGVVAGRMNGDTKAYDNYSIPIPIINAYEAQLDPYTIPPHHIKGHHFGRGDNPVTKVIEKFSGVSSTTFYDNSTWNEVSLRLPLDVITGKTSFPENVSTTAIPTNVSIQDAFVLVNAHEFTHQAQSASGSLICLPYEGMAVGVELDPHASGGIFTTFRSGAFSIKLIRTTRGEFTAMRPDVFEESTYGMGIWWKYLQDQFDFNNQVMRRTLDVLASETFGPLIKKYNYPDPFAAYPVNDVGGSAALNQALGDLFGKNIKDVWNDYSISITLLRNNTSIPPKWRHYFPYWIYNTEYDGYDKLLAGGEVLGLEAFTNWWENMDDNAVIPPEYDIPEFTGETFIRTLPDYFETDALSLRTFAFNVTKPSEDGPNKIKLKVTQGEWRVTLVQFTSDGTREGSFIADGPHTLIAGGTDTLTFDVANHSPSFSETGNIRLICVNVTFDATGKQLEDYFTPETPSGHIIIESL